MRWLTCLLSAALWLACSAPAWAVLQISIPTDLTAVPGGGPESFEISIYNPDAVTYDIAGFDLMLSLIPGTGEAMFTSADTGSTDYLFSGVSFNDAFGFDLNITPLPDTMVITSDLVFDWSGTILSVALAPGETRTLGRVFYELDAGVALGTTFSVAILDGTLGGPGDPLTGAPPPDIPFDTGDGEITATPEPGSLTILASLLGIGMLASIWRRRRRST
jgi:hypothetical protein